MGKEFQRDNTEKIQPATVAPFVVKVGEKVGDVVVTQIVGKGEVFFNDGRLLLGDGITVWVQHKELGADSTLCLSSGNPKVVGLDKTAFKAGFYKLL